MISMKISVFNIHPAVLFPQMGAQFLCHKDRAVHTAGTADGYGELGLSYAFELIGHEIDEFIEFLQELAGHR